MCLNFYYGEVSIKLGLRQVTSNSILSKYFYSAIPTFRWTQVCPPLERNSGVTIAICGVGTGRSCRFDGFIRYLWTSSQTTKGNTITVYGRLYTCAWTKRLTSGPWTVAFANRFFRPAAVRHAVRPCRRLVVVV